MGSWRTGLAFWSVTGSTVGMDCIQMGRTKMIRRLEMLLNWREGSEKYMPYGDQGSTVEQDIEGVDTMGERGSI